MAGPFDDLTKTRPAAAPAAPTGGVPFWGDSPESWDTVTIAGYSLPGLCTVRGKVKRRTDGKKKAGVHGATITYDADDVAEFSVSVKMWTDEHLSTYAKVLTFLRGLVLASSESPRNAEATIDARQRARATTSKFPLVPVEVRHPALDLLRIKAAHVVEYSLPESDGDAADGIYVATIHCLEYVPVSTGKRGGVKTPKGAVDSSISSRGPGAIGRRLQKPKPSEVNPRAP